MELQDHLVALFLFVRRDSLAVLGAWGPLEIFLVLRPSIPNFYLKFLPSSFNSLNILGGIFRVFPIEVA